MTFEQLRILQAIVEQGGLIAAAKKLGKAQPSVSSSLNRLEEQLGVRLFSRDKYRIEITEAGSALYQQACDILARSTRFDALAEHLRVGNEAQIRISVEVICPNHLLLTALKQVQSQYPLCQFQFCSDVMTGGFEKLMANEVDFVCGPNIYADENVQSRYLGTTKIGPVAAPSYLSLLQLDFERSVQIILKNTAQKKDNTRFGVQDNINQWVASDYQMKKDMLLAAMGWGLMPYHLISNELASGQLVAVDREELPVKEPAMYAFCLRNRAVGPVGRATWDALSCV
jgi:DNA-binding transcriptional LysR family regulator